jgi:hypothetical protein
MAVLYRIRNLFWVQCRPASTLASNGISAISNWQIAIGQIKTTAVRNWEIPKPALSIKPSANSFGENSNHPSPLCDSLCPLWLAVPDSQIGVRL